MEKKSYEEMNVAEQTIMDYLQIIAYQRTNSRKSYPPTDAEMLLREIAERLNLI